MVFQKIWFGWVNISRVISGVSRLKFTKFLLFNAVLIGRRNRGRRNKNPICFGDIRRRTSNSSEIGPNFACFSPPKFFWGVPPKILDQHYKIGPSTDHCAKFHAGRPTHLGDLASGEKKIKKTSGLKLKSAPQAIAFGRTKKLPFNYKAYVHYVVVVENRLLIKMKRLWDYEMMIILPLWN